MRQFLSTYIYSTDDLFEEPLPIAKAEFTASLSLVACALAVFGLIIHVFGS